MKPAFAALLPVASLGAMPADAFAQAWPAKPTILVPDPMTQQIKDDTDRYARPVRDAKVSIERCPRGRPVRPSPFSLTTGDRP